MCSWNELTRILQREQYIFRKLKRVNVKTKESLGESTASGVSPEHHDHLTCTKQPLSHLFAHTQGESIRGAAQHRIPHSALSFLPPLRLLFPKIYFTFAPRSTLFRTSTHNNHQHALRYLSRPHRRTRRGVSDPSFSLDSRYAV